MNSGIFSVHLPVSIAADTTELREKTLKIGQVGRALAIFRINQVFIYDDGDQNVKNREKESNIITTLLRYLETPQYLRKGLFPYMEELRFAGALPPLRTPHHPLREERNEEGDCREAMVMESGDGDSRLALGLSEEGIFEGELEEGVRLTVRLGKQLDQGRRIVRPVERDSVEDYWGFEIFEAESLSQSLIKAGADYNVGTSRRGQNLYEVMDGIKKKSTNTVAVAFGGPYQGLFEICEKQGADSEVLFGDMVNVIPQQGTETVRTEEALYATLAIMNILIGRK